MTALKCYFSLSLWKNNFELGVGGKGQDTSRHLKVVFGPYVQYCPCEASEQKLDQKLKSGLKVIALSYCHHSICLEKKRIKNWIKNDRVMPILCSCPKVTVLAYFVPIDGYLGQMF